MAIELMRKTLTLLILAVIPACVMAFERYGGRADSSPRGQLTFDVLPKTVATNTCIRFTVVEDNGTNLYDYSSNTEFGCAANNGYATNSGETATRLVFDGVDDKWFIPGSNATINIGSSVPRTFMAWLKRSRTNIVERLLTHADSDLDPMPYTYGCPADNSLYTEIRKDTDNRIQVRWGAGTFPTGVWYHVAITYDGTQSTNGFAAYRDGVPLDVTSVTELGDVSAGLELQRNAVLGAIYDNIPSTQHYEGEMRQVILIRARVLTQAEITNVIDCLKGELW